MNLDRLYQLLAQLFEIGTIVGVDEAAGRYTVKIGDDDKDANTQYLPAVTQRAGTNKSGDLYEEGEQVLVVCLAGDLRQGIIIGALNSDTHPAPTTSKHIKNYTFEDGTVLSYNKQTHHLSATVKGSADIHCDDDVNVTSDKNVTVNATETLTLLAETINITSSQGDAMINGVSLLNHTHPQNNGNDLGGGVNTSAPNKVI